MFYIHHTSCISPQTSFLASEFNPIAESNGDKLKVVEPSYDNIPPAMLRRMGKAVRIGVGAALKVLSISPGVEGIIIGTANGGLEDCIKFLNQIMEYEEGTLTPTNFVQSTANAIASQVALLSHNKGYNISHVHRGLAFEHAAIDVSMLIKENPSHHYLLGGIEEISSYNYNINYLEGWYKKNTLANTAFYDTDSPGSIAGEGAAIFAVNGQRQGATAHLKSLLTLHGESKTYIVERFQDYLHKALGENESIDLLLSGENGDNRLLDYYLNIEAVLGENVPVARFKHLTGEFETVTALSTYIACEILHHQTLPEHMLKTPINQRTINNILIYNTSKGYQHSFLLLSKVN